MRKRFGGVIIHSPPKLEIAIDLNSSVVLQVLVGVKASSQDKVQSSSYVTKS